MKLGDFVTIYWTSLIKKGETYVPKEIVKQKGLIIAEFIDKRLNHSYLKEYHHSYDSVVLYITNTATNTVNISLPQNYIEPPNLIYLSNVVQVIYHKQILLEKTFKK